MIVPRTWIGLLAIGALLPPAPALANHEAATAAVLQPDVPAGARDVQIEVEVRHPAAPGGLLDPPAAPIDHVAIRPPTGLLTATGVAPSGPWQGSIQQGTVVFANGQIQAGQAAVFRMLVDAARPAQDASGSWSVSTSADGGATSRSAQPQHPGALASTLRVLRVSSVSIVAPAGAADASVTAGQAACLRMRVRNGGSARVAFSPSLVGTGVETLSTQPASDPPCAGDVTAPVLPDVDAGEEAAVDARVRFTEPGIVAVLAGASGAGVEALPATVTVTVQSGISLEPGSLQPRGVPPGAGDVPFGLTVVKAPQDSPALLFDPAQSWVELPGCGRRAIEEAGLPAGTSTGVVSFEPCTVGDLADGRYPVALHLRGVDANGEAYALDAAVTDGLIVDSTAPSASTSITPPAPYCCVPPERAAIRNLQPLQVEVSAADADPATGIQEPCTPSTCEVKVGLLHYADEECTSPTGGRFDLPFGGDGGTVSPLFSPGTRGIRAEVRVLDLAGNGAAALSNCVTVDNVPPRMTRASLVDEWVVRVDLNGCVTTAFGLTSRFDWSPTPIEIRPIQEPGCIRGLELVYLGDPGPGLTYNRFELNERFRDRVGHTMLWPVWINLT